MENEKVSNSLSNNSEQGKSRRGFLKKSSAVAGISMLPASNVWGVCTVTGVSGGSPTANNSSGTCRVSPFVGGMSPQQWGKQLSKNATSNSENVNTNQNIFSMSDDSSSDNDSKQAAKQNKDRQLIRDHLNNSTINFFGNDLIPSLYINIGQVLREGSTAPYKKKLIAAVFANVTLGLVELPAQFHGPSGLKDFIEHLWGSLNINPAQAESMIAASFIANDIDESALSEHLSRGRLTASLQPLSN